MEWQTLHYWVTVAGRTHQVEVSAGRVTLDGQPVQAELETVPGTGIRSLLRDGASHRLVARREAKGSWELSVLGQPLSVQVLDERQRAVLAMTGGVAASPGPHSLRAPMPGLVVRVEVEEGQRVEPGQGLVIVEAMKMENELTAQSAARVRKVYAQSGETVEKDEVLIEFETLEEKA